MSLPSVVTRWFDGLQPREQRILRIGLPLIGLIVLLGSFGALLDAREAAMQRWQRAIALEPRIALLLVSGQTFRETSSEASASNSLLLTSARTEAGVTTLTIDDLPFEQVLEQIAAWERTGGRIQQLQLRRATDGRVSGEIRGTLTAR